MAAKLKWPTKRLGDLAEFRNGVNYNKSSFGVGIKVVGVSDFQDYTKPRYAELEQINPDGIVTERNILRDGDIVFVRSNGNRELIGRSLFIEQPPEEVTHSAFSIRLRFTSREVHPKFYAYCFRTPLIRHGLTAQGGGTNINNLNQDILNALEVPLPPLPVQRRIAGILSAYDELMENSQRRIRVLEAMARALYREWFVHFRFPGHENLPHVASPLGDIPQGWEFRKLADFVTTKYGYTESTNAEPVGPKYLRGMDINKTSFIDWSEVPYCPISPEDHESYRLRVGDVVVIRMADPGKVGIVEQEVDAVFASYLIRVAPKDSRLSPYFLFYLMESAEYYAFITGASTGTTRKSASAGVIAEYRFVLPPQELVKQFERRVSEIRSLLTTLLKKTVNLRRTRDLLLPRLLSGQVNLAEN
jgi:type I restriction enzyme S subunit